MIIKQLKDKEQECEELKKELHKNFEEKDKLHLIIDRLLEASGYDTNIASAEDFEDVYANMSYEKLQLDQLKQTITEIKKIAEDDCKTCTVKLLGEDKINCKRCYKTKILQKCKVIKDANIQS